MADLQRKTANLFDKSKRTNNSRVVYTTGEIGALPSVFVSDFTPIEPNTTYTLNLVSSISNKTGHLFALYDENKNFVNTGAHEATSATVYTFTTPSNVAYIRFNGNMASVDSIMLNTGSTALPYEPYGWVHSLRKLTTSTDTFTTLPADIYADGNNATVGISGNTVQNGTPTSDNPIMPQGTGERTVNLCDIDGFTSGETEIKLLQTIKLNAGTYTYSCMQKDAMTSNSRNSLVVRVNQGGYIYEYTLPNYHLNAGAHSLTFTVPSDNATIELRYWVNSFSNACDFDSFMLNLGSTALPYEPYGYKIPISSANTTTPVYLGEVESTRKIKKLVLTGEEAFTQTSDYQQSSRFRLVIDDALRGADTYTVDTIISTHYKSKTGFGIGTIVQSNGIDINCTFCMQSSEYPDLTTFKAYLAAQYAAGTPVTVWYVLATPTTGIVNEPIRKIGDYADTVSGITIPTITGANSFDVLTTLKPSEVELTYTGWHDATVKEWDGSQWQ